MVAESPPDSESQATVEAELQQTCLNGSATVLKTGRQKHAIIYDDRFLLNLRRRLEDGASPDLEITSYLAEADRLAPVPAFVGAIEYLQASQDKEDAASTLATLHRFVHNQGDAWHFTVDLLDRYFEHVLATFTTDPDLTAPRDGLMRLVNTPLPPLAEQVRGASLRTAELLGQRVAELHLALGQPTDDVRFQPEPFTQSHQRSLYQRLRSHVLQTVNVLRRSPDCISAELADSVRRLTEQPERLLGPLGRLLPRKLPAWRIRCHGNLHLGKVMYTGKDFLIFDFDGLPHRPVTHRRMKRCSLMDVASLARSFQHAAERAVADLMASGVGKPETRPRLERWAAYWVSWSTVAMLTKYFSTLGAALLPPSPEDRELLFDVMLLERDLEELDTLRAPLTLRNVVHWLELAETPRAEI